jgi:hypothetical protein
MISLGALSLSMEANSPFSSEGIEHQLSGAVHHLVVSIERQEMFYN